MSRLETALALAPHLWDAKDHIDDIYERAQQWGLLLDASIGLPAAFVACLLSLKLPVGIKRVRVELLRPVDEVEQLVQRAKAELAAEKSGKPAPKMY